MNVDEKCQRMNYDNEALFFVVFHLYNYTYSTHKLTKNTRTQTTTNKSYIVEQCGGK